MTNICKHVNKISCIKLRIIVLNGADGARPLCFKMAHYGSPSTDMVRLLCSSLSGKDRRENWESLLEKFYSFLQKEIDGEEMPYTIDMVRHLVYTMT